MKLVFIIINKSPITLNWVINLAGKSNSAIRVIPFPEGALQGKAVAAPASSPQWQACSLVAHSPLLIYSGHMWSTDNSGSVNGKSVTEPHTWRCCSSERGLHGQLRKGLSIWGEKSMYLPCARNSMTEKVSPRFSDPTPRSVLDPGRERLCFLPF